MRKGVDEQKGESLWQQEIYGDVGGQPQGYQQPAQPTGEADQQESDPAYSDERDKVGNENVDHPE